MIQDSGRLCIKLSILLATYYLFITFPITSYHPGAAIQTFESLVNATCLLPVMEYACYRPPLPIERKYLNIHLKAKAAHCMFGPVGMMT